MKNVWNRYRSLALSHMLVKAMLVLIIAFAVALPYITQVYCGTLVAETAQRIKIPLIISLYIAVVPVFLAVISLDRLLANIKKDIVFDRANVKYLRHISWYCYITGGVFVLLGFYIFLSFILAIAAIFFGLIIRVVKNLFCEAVEIKSENDLTI